jgi:hypothetical protein
MDQAKTKDKNTTVAFAADEALAYAIKQAAKKELFSASAICRRAVVTYLFSGEKA